MYRYVYTQIMNWRGGVFVARSVRVHNNACFMETIEHIKNLPMLGSGAIHIWGANVPMFGNRLEELKAVLCPEEAAKAERFHRDADRASSIVARGALRILLSGYTGLTADELRFQYQETGKPYLLPDQQQGSRDACGTGQNRQGCPPREIAFNISHSGGWVVLAIGRNRNIGVDVETIRRDMDVMAIASRYFTLEETALIEQADDQHVVFFNLWSRKEAYVKAIGSGLFRELSSFSVPIIGNELPEVSEKDGWIFQRLEAGSKYAAAVVTDKPINALPCFDFSALRWEF